MLATMRKRLGRKTKHQSDLVESQPERSERLPDPDQAWKALSLVNEWIRHAEAKATATLVASGVTGGVLFNLVHPQTHASLALVIVATINALMIIASAGSAVMALSPRLTVKEVKEIVSDKLTSASSTTIPEDVVNLLYFRDIARHYRGDAPTYIQVLGTLTSNPQKLIEYIGRQVHANSDVAHRKYGWANRATVFLALDLIMLGVTAILIAHY